MQKQVLMIIISLLLWASTPVWSMIESEESQNKTTSWKFLNKGEPIEIIAPGANALSAEQVKAAQELILEHGFVSILREGAIQPRNSFYGYYANYDKERAEYFKKAVLGESNVLWALRGGFGSTEVLDVLERASFTPPKQPKAIIGFSDITALHLQAAKWKWPSLHGPVLGYGFELWSGEDSEVNRFTRLSDVFEILEGKKTSLEYHSFDIIHHPNENRPILEIHGSVLGGNLSVIENHMGTATALDGKNRFVFLEDTTEGRKRLYRRLVGLKRTHVFDEAKGIIFGDIPVRVKEYETAEEETQNVLHRFVKDVLLPAGINIPVIYSPYFGHGPRNGVLPFGTKAKLSMTSIIATLEVSVNESAYD